MVPMISQTMVILPLRCLFFWGDIDDSFAMGLHTLQLRLDGRLLTKAIGTGIGTVVSFKWSRIYCYQTMTMLYPLPMDQEVFGV